jgi:hypothetical protein
MRQHSMGRASAPQTSLSAKSAAAAEHMRCSTHEAGPSLWVCGSQGTQGFCEAGLTLGFLWAAARLYSSDATGCGPTASAAANNMLLACSLSLMSAILHTATASGVVGHHTTC